MILYDAFYLLDTNRIIEYFHYNTKPSFGNGIICIPPKHNEPNNNFVWAGYDCEITRERLICPVCKSDEASRLFGKPIHGMIALHCHNAVAESFIPCFDLVVTESFVDSLKRTEFTGYELFPLNTFLYGTPTQPRVYLLECHGNVHDKEAERRLVREYPNHCVNCHWGPRCCPECLWFVTECPKCGHQVFKSDKPIPDDELQPERIEIQYLDRIESYFPLSCEHWDGSDFVEGIIVSGRVAKWLVENEYGPVFLLPYPADTSKCSDDQLQRINMIRYSPHIN